MKRLIISLFVLTTFALATTINVPTDQTTIQAGIDAASNGDTVLVAAGTYTETINYNGKNIVVGSLYLTTSDTSYISSTIIDGNQSGSVVTFDSGEDSTALLIGFSIINGYASEGGGIRCNSSSPTLKYLTIENNYGQWGGGMSIDTATPVIEHITIRNNSAQHDGAGIRLSASSPRISNVEVSSNNVGNYCGIYCYSNSNPTLTNVIIINNQAGSGAGMGCILQSSPVLINVTIANNIAENASGLWCSQNSHPTLINSIIWNESSEDIYTENSSVNATFSAIRGGWEGTGNIDLDPMFADTANADYNLQLGSPCVDAGDPNSPYDPDGTIADMGAYYYHQTYFGPIWYVSTSGSSSGFGTSSSPLATIQAGINAASNGDTVLVAAGTYVENINFNGKNIAVIGSDSSNTIIDGNQAGSVVSFANGEDSTAVLSGFTITNGSFSDVLDGGGIYCLSSNPSLKNIKITGNSATWGGGIYCNNSSPSLKNVMISGNTASQDGGGIYCRESSSPILKNVMIANNSASGGNSDNGGGGIYCTSSDMILQNVSITNNSGYRGGGIDVFNNCNVNLVNVTIVENSAPNAGGGIYSTNSTLDMMNCILWNNTPNGIDGTANVIYSDIEEGWDGIGNIDVDPMFVDTDNDDYHLADWSPCIGTGLDTSIVDTIDLDGNPRPNPEGSNPDMGAYENALGTPAEHIVITNDSLVVLEDSSSTIDLLDNDLILNITSFTFAIVDSADNGTIALVGDTALSYSPNANFFGYDTVSYRVFSSEAADTGLVFITVTAVNDAPVLSDIGDQTTPEDVVLTIPINASDVDSDSLNITATSDSPEDVNIEIEMLEIVVDIDGNVYETVQIGDQLWMAENLKVTHYNDGTEIPTGYSNTEWAYLSAGAYAVYDDNESNADTYGYLYNWYAVETGNLAPEGWHVPTDGEYTALSDYLGGESVAGGKMKECTEGSCPESEYWNSPNTGATNESGFTGLPGGYRTYGSGYYYQMGGNGKFWSSTEYSSYDAWYRELEYNKSEIIQLLSNKVDGFSVRCVRGEIATAYLKLIPSENFNGSVNITVNASDGFLTDTDDFILTITAVNDAPILASIEPQTTNEDTAKIIILSATDVEEDNLTYSATSADTNVTASVSNDTLTLTPAADSNGTADITVIVTDGALSDTTSFTFTVNPVNDDPVASDTSFTTDEDAAVAITFTATDADGDALTYDVVDSPAYGTISGSSGPENSLTFDGIIDYIDLPDNISFSSSSGVTVSMWVKSSWSDYRFTLITFNNGTGFPNTHTQRYELQKNSGSGIKFFTEGGDLGSHTFVNYQPDYTALANEWVFITGTADFDSYKLYINGELVAENTNVSPSDFILSSSGDSRIGGDVYGSSIDDYTGLMDEVSIWSTALTQSQIQSYMTTPSTGNESGLVGYWDFNEGSGSTVTDQTSNGNDGTIYGATWSDDSPYTILTYSPNANYNGTDSFTFTANDGSETSNTATVSITITAVDDVPIASNDTVTTNEDTDYSGTLMASDGDGDALTFSIIDSTVNGTVTLSDPATGTFTYSPLANFNGSDSLLFSASDGMLLDTGSVTIVVTTIDDLPVVANPLPDITINEDASDTTLGDLKNVFLDVDEDLIYSHAVNDAGLVFVSVTNDTVTLQFLADANGSTEIVFTATNPTTRASVSDTALVTVLPMNDAPEIISSFPDTSMVEDETLSLFIQVYDMDGDSLTIYGESDTGAVSVNWDGELITMTSALDWNGSAGITVIVMDDSSASDTLSFILTVDPANDPPEEFSVIYPTVSDTFSSHTDNDTLIQFTWGKSNDVDSDIIYKLTIELAFFGNIYTDIHENISDTTIGVSSNSLDPILDVTSQDEAVFSYSINASDGQDSVWSNNGEFVLSRAALGAVDGYAIPDEFALHQNYPNPFNPVTTLRYDLPENGHVNITIYDMLGRQIKTLINHTQDAGYRSVIWDATNDYGKPVSAGIYLYQIQAGEYMQTKKMVLLK